MKRNFLLLSIFVLTFLCILSCGSQKAQSNQLDTEVSKPEEIKDALNYIAKNLDKATFLTVREGWVYDYGFTDGWLLNKFEYVRTLVSYQDFQSMLDYPIYLTGPHSKDELKLNSKYSFGHYNPKFVTELRKSASLLLSEKKFITSTKPLLEEYGILEFLSKHKDIYEITQKYPEEFNSIKLSFTKEIDNKTWSESGYRSMIPELLDSEEYWNWSETSYHFWVRRDIDNTKELWIGLINDILKAYDY